MKLWRERFRVLRRSGEQKSDDHQRGKNFSVWRGKTFIKVYEKCLERIHQDYPSENKFFSFFSLFSFHVEAWKSFFQCGDEKNPSGNEKLIIEANLLNKKWWWIRTNMHSRFENFCAISRCVLSVWLRCHMKYSQIYKSSQLDVPHIVSGFSSRRRV